MGNLSTENMALSEGMAAIVFVGRKHHGIRLSLTWKDGQCLAGGKSGNPKRPGEGSDDAHPNAIWMQSRFDRCMFLHT